jgi:hypothetical protein
MMKQPFSCSLRKVARLSAVVTGMFLSVVCLIVLLAVFPAIEDHQ